MIFLGWRESTQAYRLRPLRVTAQLLSLIALLGLALRPSYSFKVSEPSLLLITENYSTKVSDSLMKVHKDLLLVTAPGVKQVEGGMTIGTYNELPRKGQLRFVTGDGIETSALSLLNDESFSFIPGKEPNGIIALQTGPYEENRRSWVKGAARGMKKSVIRLIGPGGIEDSVRFTTGNEVDFALKFTTKRAGRYVYTLTTVDSAGKRTEDAVPVEVVASRKLSILLLQTYPVPEVRFLKNYLSDKGHTVTARYQLSKNAFRYEWANGASEKLDKLSTGLLGEFDLVITDEEALGQLPAAESVELERAVRDGLGLLMLLQRSPESRRFPGSVLHLSPEPTAPDTIRFTVPDFATYVSPYVALKVNRRDLVQPVLTSGRAMLSGFVLHGDGKVGFQALMESYRLSLSGETAPFAALWTPLLEQIARRLDQRLQAHVTTVFPVYPEEPIEFEILSVSSPEVSVSGARVPMAEDVHVDGLWHGTTWRSALGWSAISIRGDSSRFNTFVSAPGSWKALRIANQQKANARQATALSSSTSGEHTVQRPISPVVFFVIFLLSFAFVWFAPKF